MANVFLSYDRDDAGKARPIALALEKAGHSVWWDQHLRSGAEFVDEIERELEKAEAIVVLWSQAAVKSPWVRDEASAGRDRKCLVPATIDGTQPPLGFRQYQTTDLSTPRSRPSRAQLERLLVDIASISITEGNRREPDPKAVSSIARRRRSTLPFIFSVAAGLLLVGVAYLWYSQRAPIAAPTVAVVGAGNSAANRNVARDLIVRLGDSKFQDRSQFRLLPLGSSDRAQFVLTVETASENPSKVAVSLTSTGNNAILWSQQFGQNQVTWEESLAYAAALSLRCALDMSHDRQAPSTVSGRALYFEVCSSVDRPGDDREAAVAKLHKVLLEAPRFEAAWRLLLQMQSVLLLNKWMLSSDAAGFTKQAEQDIAAARKFDPNMAEVALAEITARPDQSFETQIKSIDSALSTFRDSAALYNERSFALRRVGRLLEAADDARKAADLDPLSSTYGANYANVLLATGNVEAARDQLRKAQARWPSSKYVGGTAILLEVHYGDVEKAMKAGAPMLDSGVRAYIAARKQPTKSNVDAFVNLALTHSLADPQKRFVIQALPELGRSDQLYGLLAKWPVDPVLRDATPLLFLPWNVSMRRDPRFMAFARSLGLTDYWRKSGKWPDFCTEPDLPYDCKSEAAGTQ